MFYNKGNAAGERLAWIVQQGLNSLYGKEGARSRNAASGDFFMLKCSDCPSVLVECGFLSNREDERLLTSSAWKKALAETMAGGVMAYFSDLSA